MTTVVFGMLSSVVWKVHKLKCCRFLESQVCLTQADSLPISKRPSGTTIYWISWTSIPRHTKDKFTGSGLMYLRNFLN